MKLGQSLVVWGITEGRQAAREVDTYLQVKNVNKYFQHEMSKLNIFCSGFLCSAWPSWRHLTQ